MASISEFERARMINALAGAIGKEEASVLASALNLDGQLASRDELRVTEMAIRTDIADLRDNLRSEIATVRDDLRAEIGSVRDDVHALRLELYTVKDDLKDGFARSLQQQTRSLFFGILGGIGTITGAVMVALRVAGKL